MKYYELKDNRTDDEMLDLDALRACELNDFDSFDSILFGEDVEPDFNKFYLGDLNYPAELDRTYCEYSVALPFYKPTTMVEYQINHYVMWGVIAIVKTDNKPQNMYDYNTGFCMSIPENTCWACQWVLKHEKRYFCQICPIWYSQDLYKFMCESNNKEERMGKDEEDLDGYYKWDNSVNSEEKFEHYATILQRYTWHTEFMLNDSDI